MTDAQKLARALTLARDALEDASVACACAKDKEVASYRGLCDGARGMVGALRAEFLTRGPGNG
jgi:hypothetical protein